MADGMVGRGATAIQATLAKQIRELSGEPFNQQAARAVLLAALDLTDQEIATLGESTGLGAQNCSEVIGDLRVMAQGVSGS